MVPTKPVASGSQTVERALAVLDLLADRGTPLRLSDIAHQSGFDISTTSRLLNSLQRFGYVVREATSGRYRLGDKLLYMSQVVQQQSGLRDIADPILQALVDATGETATVNVLQDAQIMVTARIVSAYQLRIFTPVGTRSPIHCTAAGKAILAYQAPEEIDRILRLGMPRHTALTITDPVTMAEELAHIRQLGYAIDRGEREDGLIGFAAPIRNATGEVFGSCGISGAESHLPLVRVGEVIGAITEAAATLSAALGWQNDRHTQKP